MCLDRRTWRQISQTQRLLERQRSEGAIEKAKDFVSRAHSVPLMAHQNGGILRLFVHSEADVVTSSMSAGRDEGPDEAA